MVEEDRDLALEVTLLIEVEALQHIHQPAGQDHALVHVLVPDHAHARVLLLNRQKTLKWSYVFKKAKQE